jgi:hypothetical protein
MINRQNSGVVLFTAGLVVSGLALRAWQTSADTVAAPDGQPNARQANAYAAESPPGLAASTIAVSETGEGFRVPTADEMARAREAIAVELELFSPGPVRQIPTTSGVGYTLGMRGASVALFWPQHDGAMGVRCHDVPAPGVLALDVPVPGALTVKEGH